MIKWIVCDMDGTLLDPHDQISERTRNALLRAQQQGIRLILASGRSYSRLMAYADLLEMAKYQGMLIEVNGMALYDLSSGKRTIIQRLNQQDIQTIFQYFRSFDVEIVIYGDQELRTFIPKSVEKLKQEYRKQAQLSDDYPWVGGAWQLCNDMRNGYPYQYYIGHLPDFPFEANKVAITQEKDVVAEAYEAFVKDFAHQYEVTRPCPRYCEVNPKGVSKGAALKRLMDEAGIQPSEVLVFGDGENDFSMFACSDHAYAMKNAQEHVKQHANHVCDDNAHEGVAKVIEEVVFHEVDH